MSWPRVTLRDGIDEHYDTLMRSHLDNWAGRKRGAARTGARPDDPKPRAEKPDVDVDIDKPKAGLEVVRLSDVKPEPVEWLWRDHLAIGKIALLGGAPGLGKSLISLDAIARITTGRAWPDGAACQNGSAIVLASEDGLADTIRPRLEAAGGDAERIRVVLANRNAKGDVEPLDLSRHLAELGALIKDLADVRLVVIDPITSYMGEKTDAYKTADVRRVLDPVAAFAERHRVSILAITHPPKGQQSSAVNSYGGSLAFVAVARLAFIVVKDKEDDERRLLLPAKCNIGKMPAGRGYRVKGTALERTIDAPRIDWDDDPVHTTADEALQWQGAPKAGKLDEAEDFLREQLSSGPKGQEGLFKVAGDRGISEKTLRRAKGRLDIVSKKSGFEGGWTWGLPA